MDEAQQEAEAFTQMNAAEQEMYVEERSGMILNFLERQDENSSNGMIYDSLMTLMKVALSMGRSSDVNSTVKGLKEEIKELSNELEHGGMVGDSTDTREIIKELEEDVEKKDKEIKGLRSGW